MKKSPKVKHVQIAIPPVEDVTAIKSPVPSVKPPANNTNRMKPAGRKHARTKPIDKSAPRIISYYNITYNTVRAISNGDVVLYMLDDISRLSGRSPAEIEDFTAARDIMTIITGEKFINISGMVKAIVSGTVFGHIPLLKWLLTSIAHNSRRQNDTTQFETDTLDDIDENIEDNLLYVNCGGPYLSNEFHGSFAACRNRLQEDWLNSDNCNLFIESVHNADVKSEDDSWYDLGGFPYPLNR